MHILITGPGGSGKTTLAMYFRSFGYNAFDGDLAGIGEWTDGDGNTIDVPDGQDMKRINEWAETNGLSWKWVRGRLMDLLSSSDEEYLMGSASNAFELAELFDRVYYLSCGETLIRNRLKKRAEDGDAYHDNGSTDNQRDEIVRKMLLKRKEALKLGFCFVDASLSLVEIMSVIASEST